MTRAQATTIGLWLLIAALAVTGGLLLRPTHHSSAATSAAPAVSSTTRTPSGDVGHPTPAATARPVRATPVPPAATTSAPGAQQNPTSSRPAPARAETAPRATASPRARLGPAAALRAYLHSHEAWTWKTTRHDLDVNAARYTTADFAKQLRSRDPATWWPQEWELAHQLRGTRRLYLETVSLNQAAPNTAQRRFYVVRATTVLTNPRGQVLVQHRHRSMSFGLTNRGSRWLVFTDQDMG